MSPEYGSTPTPPGRCDTSLVHKRAAYIFGYVDTLNWKWLDCNRLIERRCAFKRAIMSGAVTNALRGLLVAAAAMGLSLTNAAQADLVLVGDTAFVHLGDQGFDAVGLQKGNAVFNLTAAEQAALKASGSSGSSVLGCGAPATCGPSNAGPGSFLGLARSAVTTPLPGAIFLFGSVLFGGLGMSARKARRRNRGAVSLLA